jgi:hypothetical protein
MSRGSLKVLLTKADVMQKPKDVTHQDKSHAKAWLSKWPCCIHITLEHFFFKQKQESIIKPNKVN